VGAAAAEDYAHGGRGPEVGVMGPSLTGQFPYRLSWGCLAEYKDVFHGFDGAVAVSYEAVCALFKA
jgi:hypothetical protein